MQGKRKRTSRTSDGDDAPPLDAAWFAGAALYDGGKLVRPAKRGRPALARPKRQVTLRLDSDVVDGFRAMGAGWQTEINDTLKRALRRRA